MVMNYDNWERLVKAVLLREQFRELALLSSPSISSLSSSSSYRSSSQFQDQTRENSSSKLPEDYSDIVIDHAEWKTMLPPGQRKVVWRSASMSFFLDNKTRKNCFIIGARRLLLSRGYRDGLRDEELLRFLSSPGYSSSVDDEEFFSGYSNATNFEEWRADYPNSRFEDVAVINDSPRTYIRGRIRAQMLSPETLYAAYLMFHLPENETGSQVVGSALTTCKMVNIQPRKEMKKAALMLHPREYSKEALEINIQQAATRRADGWMELEMGDFYINRGDNRGVEARLLMIQNRSPLIVEGIELRPKHTRTLVWTQSATEGHPQMSEVGDGLAERREAWYDEEVETENNPSYYLLDDYIESEELSSPR